MRIYLSHKYFHLELFVLQSAFVEQQGGTLVAQEVYQIYHAETDEYEPEIYYRPAHAPRDKPRATDALTACMPETHAYMAEAK